MFTEIMVVAGMSAISYAIANALNAFAAYRESIEKYSLLDKLLEYVHYLFFCFGLLAFLAIGSSHEYIQKLSITNILDKHDRDISKMEAFAWDVYRYSWKVREDPYTPFNFDEQKKEVIDSLEIKPWKYR